MMSNINANIPVTSIYASKDTKSHELLEKTIQDLYDNDKINSLSIPEISNIAQQFNVSAKDVMECIENLKPQTTSKNNPIEERQELNGASGYYWGASRVPASSDSMSNLNNYSNWIKAIHGLH